MYCGILSVLPTNVAAPLVPVVVKVSGAWKLGNVIKSPAPFTYCEPLPANANARVPLLEIGPPVIPIAFPVIEASTLVTVPG